MRRAFRRLMFWIWLNGCLRTIRGMSHYAQGHTRKTVGNRVTHVIRTELSELVFTFADLTKPGELSDEEMEFMRKAVREDPRG